MAAVFHVFLGKDEIVGEVVPVSMKGRAELFYQPSPRHFSPFAMYSFSTNSTF